MQTSQQQLRILAEQSCSYTSAIQMVQLQPHLFFSCFFDALLIYSQKPPVQPGLEEKREL